MEAFQELLPEIFPSRGVNFAAKFLGGRATAEEIAQECFPSLRWQNRYGQRPTFSTWLFKIVS